MWDSNEDRDESDAGESEDLEGAALVTCPYCGEQVEITLDPGGGSVQEYVEDCEVCCRPWQVHVRYKTSGSAEVWLEES